MNLISKILESHSMQLSVRYNIEFFWGYYLSQITSWAWIPSLYCHFLPYLLRLLQVLTFWTFTTLLSFLLSRYLHHIIFILCVIIFLSILLLQVSHQIVWSMSDRRKDQNVLFQFLLVPCTKGKIPHLFHIFYRCEKL